VLVCEGTGSWLEYVQFNGQVYWTVDDERPQWTLISDPSVPPQWKEYFLPSDSQLRADMGPLKRKNWEEAEREKV
jgi:hypothetical protein